jgi:hypothetical protein
MEHQLALLELKIKIYNPHMTPGYGNFMQASGENER